MLLQVVLTVKFMLIYHLFFLFHFLFILSVDRSHIIEANSSSCQISKSDLHIQSFKKSPEIKLSSRNGELALDSALVSPEKANLDDRCENGSLLQSRVDDLSQRESDLAHNTDQLKLLALRVERLKGDTVRIEIAPQQESKP